eukprot:COSAG04_NODE_744_length_10648_cov_52.358233_2_plen_93_part_00
MEQVAKNHSLTWGDFPDHRVYKAKLKRDDFYKMAPLHPKLIAAMEQVLHTDIPKLMAMLPDVRHTKSISISCCCCISICHGSEIAFRFCHGL